MGGIPRSGSINSPDAARHLGFAGRRAVLAKTEDLVRPTESEPEIYRSYGRLCSERWLGFGPFQRHAQSKRF